MYHLKIALVNSDTVEGQNGQPFAVFEEEASAPSTHALFLALQREYGRCQSALYADRQDDKGNHYTVKVGWVFERPDRYQGGGDRYTREAWVEVWKENPDGVLVPLSEGGIR